MLQQVKWCGVTFARALVFVFSLVILPAMFALVAMILLVERDVPLKRKAEILALELRDTIKAGALWVVRHT